MSLADHPRILVVGTSCAGKTTLSRKVAQALGLAHVELDELYWGPNWTPRPDFLARVDQATAAERWIADGNYLAVQNLVWGRATAAVWLNYSFRLVLWRAVLRSCRRIWSQEELFAGNRESVLRSFLHHEGIPWWVVRTFHRRRRELRRQFLRPEFSHLELLELRDPRQADEMTARWEQQIANS